jgi:hypothetical protein
MAALPSRWKQNPWKPHGHNNRPTMTGEDHSRNYPHWSQTAKLQLWLHTLSPKLLLKRHFCVWASQNTTITVAHNWCQSGAYGMQMVAIVAKNHGKKQRFRASQTSKNRSVFRF